MCPCVFVRVRVCVVNLRERWRGIICRDDFIKIEIQGDICDSVLVLFSF